MVMVSVCVRGGIECQVSVCVRGGIECHYHTQLDLCILYQKMF